jgi:hypothetical protein
LAIMLETPTEPRSLRARRRMLPIVLWAFGFATSLLLIGMWGRAVTIDSGTMAESAAAVIDSEIATERVYSWLETGISEATGVDSEAARGVAVAVADRPEFSHAVDVIVADFIDGLFAEPGDRPAVNLEEALAPLVPVIAAEAQRRDVPIEQERITGVLDSAGVIALDTGEAASVVSAVEGARTFLTKVVMLAAFLLVGLGALAVMLSDRRYAMVRTLSTRVVISALTYALMFRVASWALDPNRGRSPLLDGGSVLIGSNGHVFVISAIVATVIGVWGGWVAWRRGLARSTPIVEVSRLEDDDTRELTPA